MLIWYGKSQKKQLNVSLLQIWVYIFSLAFGKNSVPYEILLFYWQRIWVFQTGYGEETFAVQLKTTHTHTHTHTHTQNHSFACRKDHYRNRSEKPQPLILLIGSERLRILDDLNGFRLNCRGYDCVVTIFSSFLSVCALTRVMAKSVWNLSLLLLVNWLFTVAVQIHGIILYFCGSSIWRKR